MKEKEEFDFLVVQKEETRKDEREILLHATDIDILSTFIQKE